MKPPKGSGLEQIERLGKMLQKKYTEYSIEYQKRLKNRIENPVIKYPEKKKTIKNKSVVTNPLDMLVRNLTSTISNIVKNTSSEDHYTVVKGFIPDGARLLKPLYPSGSQEILATDLDGDSRNELITSFKHNDEIRTIVLKKQNEKWYKLAEINHPEHNGIHYRQIADITGEGKKQLLVGLSASGRAHTLYGYSFTGDTIKRLFSRNYHWAEMAGRSRGRNTKTKVQPVLWSRSADGTYGVEILDWDGENLFPQKDITTYYKERMTPFFIRRLKEQPNNPFSWYNLADALVKFEAYNEALTIVDAGMRRDRESILNDKFTALRNEIVERL